MHEIGNGNIFVIFVRLCCFGFIALPKSPGPKLSRLPGNEGLFNLFPLSIGDSLLRMKFYTSESPHSSDQAILSLNPLISLRGRCRKTHY